MKTLRKTKIPNPNTRLIVVPFKVNAAEMQELLKRAGAWTNRNVSEYIRYSALNFTPKRGDFQK